MYFTGSRVFNLLDRYILDDIAKITLFVPLLVISYVTAEIAAGFVFIQASEFATMPPVSQQMLNNYSNMYFSRLNSPVWAICNNAFF